MTLRELEASIKNKKNYPAFFIIKNDSLKSYIGHDTNITVPHGVINIEPNAFTNPEITSITLPSTLKIISSKAFFNLTNLKTINIPKEVHSIAIDAFYNCTSLTTITVDIENPYYKAIDNLLYSKDEKNLLYVPEGISGCVKVMDGCANIRNGSFTACRSISSVSLPKSIRNIVSYSFSGCKALLSFTIPREVKLLSNNIFPGCENLTEINIDSENPYFIKKNGLIYKKDESEIALVPPCINETVVLSDKIKTLKADTFYNTYIKELVIPSTLDFNSILIKDTFLFPTRIEKVVFQNKKQKIKEEWFSKIDNKGNILKGEAENLIHFAIGFYPSQLKSKTKEYLTPYIARLINEKCDIDEALEKEWLSYYKKNRKKLYSAICMSHELLSIMTTHSLLDLSDAQALIKLLEEKDDITSKTLLLEYIHSTFNETDVIKNREKLLFSDIENLSNIKRVWSYKKKSDNSILLINYKGDEKEIEVPSIIEGCEVSEIGDLCFSPKGKRINDNIRKKRKEITSITIPNTIKKIGDKAFWWCESLMNIKLPSTIDTIKAFQDEGFSKGYFYGCNSLKELKLPDSITKIDEYALSFSSFKTIKLPPSLSVLNFACFSNSQHLQRIEIPNTVRVIRAMSFYSCTNLLEVVSPDTIERIESRAFSLCSSLTNVIIKGKDTILEPSSIPSFSHVVIIAPKISKAHNYALKNQIKYQEL